MNKDMSDETRAALKELGVPEDEIEALAEKQKAVEPEPNEVEKEAETPPVEATVTVKKSVWERFKEAFSNSTDGDADEPDAETGGVENTEEVTETPVEAQEEKQADNTEVYKALAQAISAPLIAKLQEFQTDIEAVKGRLAEMEEAVETKVLNRLAEIPQVVKVRASAVEATVAEPEKPTGAVLPQMAPENDNYVPNLIADVTQAVADAITKAQPKATI